MAESVGGTLDVDGLLDGITPELFNEWIAYRKVSPDRFERLLTVLKLGFAAVCNCWGGEIDPEKFDPYGEEADLAEAASPAQVVDFMRSRIGAIRGDSNR